MEQATFDPLVRILLDGNREEAVKQVTILLDSDVHPEDIITFGVEKAMQQLDAKCTVDQYNLLEIMLCGRATVDVIRELYPADTSSLPIKKGTVVLATIQGDIHDLGKNIVKIILTATGYRIVDCGKDIPVEEIAETAEKEEAFAVGVSGLITPVIPNVVHVKDALAKRGLNRVKVLAGGGALKQATEAQLNVDFVAETAFDGLHYLDSVLRVPS